MLREVSGIYLSEQLAMGHIREIFEAAAGLSGIFYVLLLDSPFKTFARTVYLTL